MIGDLRQNLVPGLTVALVNVPLSISLGVAADATPEMGIITAIWAGGASAVLGGSQYNIIGPTGALSGILSATAVRHGKEVLPLLAILSGLFTLIILFARIDKMLRFVSSSTMLGFTLAVAFTIAANQLNFAMGLDPVPRHQSLLANILENLGRAQHAEWQALLLFLVLAAAQFLLTQAHPRIPWAIVTAMVGVLVGFLAGGEEGALRYRVRTLGARYPGLRLRLAAPLAPQPAHLAPSALADICGSAVSVAVVAVLETLISAKCGPAPPRPVVRPRNASCMPASLSLSPCFSLSLSFSFSLSFCR